MTRYSLVQIYTFNPIQDGTFRSCSPMGGKKSPLPPENLLRISYNDETWHSYTLPKEDPKIIWILWHSPWSIFSPEIKTFCYVKKYRYRFDFGI